MLGTQQVAGALGAGPELKPSLAMGEAGQERGWGEMLGNEFSPGVSQSLRKPRACLVHLPGLIHEDVLIKEIHIYCWFPANLLPQGVKPLQQREQKSPCFH